MSGPELLGVGMFAATIAVLLLGYPVALTLGGVATASALLGHALDLFDLALLASLPSRFVGVMLNEVLVAVPLFVFMGVMLERSGLAEQLLLTMATLLGTLRGGLGLSVTAVGALLAASTGIAGAAVVTMGLLSLPAMLRAGYAPPLACGTVCAAGTLGQIIPPSIALVLLGDVLQGANAQAQLAAGNFAPEPVSVVDLFAGAVAPGLLLVALYMAWQIAVARLRPEASPPPAAVGSGRVGARDVAVALAPPALLVLAVLGSILAGVATATEAAGVGAAGAALLAFARGRLSRSVAGESARATVRITAMIFAILLGASVFSLVFRGLGGDELVARTLGALPGGTFGAMLAVMALMFALGFVLDFVEIIFVVVPLVGPVLIAMGIDPVWLGVMIALNVQTSFLTPPFGFALFYLRGVAPVSVATADIYRGAVPFVGLQLLALGIVAAFPGLATWLPGRLFG